MAPDTTNESHLDNITLAGLLYQAWQNYLVEGLGWESKQLFGDGVVGRPIVREINVRYDAEVFSGERVLIGVRAESRRRKGFVLGQVMWNGDMAVVARGSVVLVTIDTRTGRAVDIPGELWDAIEKAEGRSIPATA